MEALFRGRNPRFFFSVAANVQTIWVIVVIVILVGPALLRFNLLGAIVGILFEPLSSLILGTCGVYVVLDPCPR